jgi:tectonin beta-propeller repeat-containing protein 1
MTDSMSFYCYENQRWNPLTGFAAKGYYEMKKKITAFLNFWVICSSGLPTDRYMWSDETGKQELTKDSIKLPSKHWQWMTDWNVDYTISDGVDADGWQYAIDFPFDYHSDRKFTDYVRRRRWYRKCKLSTTGPFTELSNIPIISISIHSPNICSNSDEDVVINAWAVSADGDALCRIGVSSMCPRGLSWKHVPCEQPFINVSVGGDEKSMQMWAIARDGSAFLRHGISEKTPSGLNKL